MDFYIMSKDIAVVKWQDDNLKIINKDLLPLYFRYSHDVWKWIKIRAIDSKRPNSRLLKKALRMTAKDDISTVLTVNAATITDNYWIKPINSDLTYADVKFDNDHCSNLSLSKSRTDRKL